MRFRMCRSNSVLIAALILAAPLVVTVAGQAQKPAAKATSATVSKWTPARTADGHPDLQGVWSFATLTPFERPGALDGKATLSDDEVEEFAQQRLETSNKDRRDGGAAVDVERAYNDFWWDYGTKVWKQPALVVDPKDGRLPPLTEQARQRGSQRRGNRFENVEERPIAERCILGFNSGPPMVPSAYNNNVQLIQAGDQVVILNEMIHNARIVPMSGRTHPAKSLRFLTGDSIGHWDGDTLVVDTTNFARDGGFRGASANMHLVERFTRVDQNTLRYDFTIDDPATWTSKWTASIPMSRSDEQIYEYACHEGNYGLEGVLKGARYFDLHPDQAPK
jgi:hypothetical protein